MSLTSKGGGCSNLVLFGRRMPISPSFSVSPIWSLLSLKELCHQFFFASRYVKVAPEYDGHGPNFEKFRFYSQNLPLFPKVIVRYQIKILRSISRHQTRLLDPNLVTKIGDSVQNSSPKQVTPTQKSFITSIIKYRDKFCIR